MALDSTAIRQAIAALRKGRFIIIVDDADRENEGDLVLAAQFATTEKLAFMIRHTGGVVCLALSGMVADLLDLPAMVERNTSKRSTPFTVSIEAKDGVDTGISAADRARTIRVAMSPTAKPGDLSRPGHVFPLRAQDGGVLWRSGHTEASVDLCRIAGLREGAVISELMNDDGTMMRLPAIRAFGRRHRIPVLTVADIIAYRKRTESLIMLEARAQLETEHGEWELSVYVDLLRKKEHVALKMGEIDPRKPMLVRVHSECITGDAFKSLHCDCGEQLSLAMQRIAQEGKGVLVYLRQEGRGIGLANKIRAYALQHLGLDTVDANRALGLPDDIREYGIGAQILRDLGVGKMRLLTNNPKKVIGLKGYGLEIVEQIPIEISPRNDRQRRYLKAKKEKLHHRLKKV
ncbi:MAG: 3,4-dihydroxy-2-butanone-4-phosphate synthase [Candidatus Peribacteraceae bacterium]